MCAYIALKVFTHFFFMFFDSAIVALNDWWFKVIRTYFMLGPSAASQFNLSLKQVVFTPQLHQLR